jgi:hypothetical protein
MKNIYKQSLLLIITLRVNYWEDNNNAIVYNKNIGFQTGSCSESLFLWRLVGIFKQTSKFHIKDNSYLVMKIKWLIPSKNTNLHL